MRILARAVGVNACRDRCLICIGRYTLLAKYVALRNHVVTVDTQIIFTSALRLFISPLVDIELSGLEWFQGIIPAYLIINFPI
jgi:hypothetical protein